MLLYVCLTISDPQSSTHFGSEMSIHANRGNSRTGELQPFNPSTMKQDDANNDEVTVAFTAFHDNDATCMPHVNQPQAKPCHNKQSGLDDYSSSIELLSECEIADTTLRLQDLTVVTYNMSQYYNRDDSIFQFSMSDNSIFLRQGEETKADEADYFDDFDGESSICDSIRVTIRRNLKATKK